jgi:hypothetical protein
MKMAVFWDVAPCSLVEVYRRLRAITLTMEAASTSETSVNFYQTTLRNIPEDSDLHTRSRENLKSLLVIFKMYKSQGGYQGKVVRCLTKYHAMQVWLSGGIAPRILNLCTRWRRPLK